MNAQRRHIRPGIDFDAFDAYLQAVYEALRQRRRDELQAQAVESGIPLPMSPDMILTFEDAGAVVELDTGWITFPSGVRAVPVLDGEVVVDIVEAKTVA